MTQATYTDAELQEFDRLTREMSSADQLTRISGRMAVRRFEADHGKAKCEAMYSALLRRDAAAGKRRKG